MVSGRRVTEAAEHVLWAGPSSQVVATRAALRVLGEVLPPRRPGAGSIRAEHFDECDGVVLSDETREAGTVVESNAAGGWVLFRDVDVDPRFVMCTLRLAGSGGESVVVELRAVGPGTGESASVVPVECPRGPYDWQEVPVRVPLRPGVSDLRVVFDRPGVRLAELVLHARS